MIYTPNGNRKLERSKVVFTKDQIQQRVKELGALISKDYQNEEVVLVCNLKGAFIFLADLCRYIAAPIAIDFIATTSYKGTATSGNVRIIKDLKMDIRGEKILIVEDIIDTGYTLEYIINYLKLHKPKEVKVVTLLDKRCRRLIEIPIAYIGYEVKDKFLIGYGLDYNEKYRELNYIAELGVE
ncbi:MAG TPA: hypoxanthine phosphoribosyltransferase [Spirochaetes bacterium]|nr:hypoxanthine phosphoribosyltransferase [Spirochaetota bacterium]